MANYRMLVQYDGTRYNGWQKQGDTDNTIQQKLEAILSRMTGGEAVDVHGAGRTDAGVHARGQVAQFRLDTEKTPEEIKDYINDYLPDDIGVTSVAVAAPRFHSRYNASTKTYLYRICKDKSFHVFDRKYMYLYRGELDTAAMKVATIFLRGEHDFRSFCGNPRMKKSTVRKLYAIHITENKHEIDLEFIGEGFLQYMVRILVGTLIEVGEGKRDPSSMKELLEAKDRNLAGPTAPARGLTLMEVKYN
ncbi:MAG: tRNA pseudouridine(38-40) synthase TruA [Lachnospiraceae bacterium]|nr:tRNA pseudouridine(38-40) synthase TruA [Lachnospiraceae bacterium]